ncbi:MAG: SCO family protein [Rhodopila sp.]
MPRVFGLVLILGMARPAWAAPPDITGLGYTQRLGADVPLGASLVAQDGQARTLQALMDGKPTLLVLGYFACPSLCGLIRNDIFSALANTTLQTPRDYSLVFLSIDPAEKPHDAAEAFRRDLAQNPVKGAAEGWHFVTADAPAISRVEEAVGYHSRYDTSLKQFLHPVGVVVLTPGGTVSSYLLGTSFQPAGLQAAVGQARDGSIGQRASPILLLCFHYDPTTGRYTLAIMKVLRLMGIMAVLTVGGMMLLLHRQGRRA